MIWPAVIVGSLGAYLLKLSGYVIPERVLDNPRLQRLTTILPIALLAALVGVMFMVVIGTFAWQSLRLLSYDVRAPTATH